MPKKELDVYDATTPELIEELWNSDLIYNSKVVGTIFGHSEREIKRYIKRWVQQADLKKC
jgi:hypothetical protein